MSDWALIMPFVKPLEHLIVDDSVSEIMVNPGGAVFLEREGRMHAAAGVQMQEDHLQAAIRSIARLLGNDVSEKIPLLDARLPDGSRVAATFPPASVGGSTLTIRKFQSRRFTADELVRLGTLSPPQLETLANAVKKRETILISGGTGSGKTTLLNALADYIEGSERIILIEDTSEISISAENLIRLEARRELPDMPPISIQTLLRQTLRMRPDRIILGEVRGAEAFDLLNALNTGHQGTLSTIHANSARASLSRLRTCIAMAGMEMAPSAIAMSIAEAIQILVHIARRDGRRVVKEVLRLEGYNVATDTYAVKSLEEM